jgi:hypothetical protein
MYAQPILPSHPQISHTLSAYELLKKKPSPRPCTRTYLTHSPLTRRFTPPTPPPNPCHTKHPKTCLLSRPYFTPSHWLSTSGFRSGLSHGLTRDQGMGTRHMRSSDLLEAGSQEHAGGRDWTQVVHGVCVGFRSDERLRCISV